ncbi:MAG TPA: TonB-dependent receptor [Burkholderiales bacterium]|nr:TonB-dependent receptor [Burkholderiales bacterium]
MKSVGLNPHRSNRRAAPRIGKPAAWLSLAALLGSAALGPGAHAQIPKDPQTRDLAALSLEELSNIKVTSVSGVEEPLSDAAASIFVITNEDIRRSAATTLPEALRLAPNLQVARVDARNYAITARGSNGVFENKMLVLIDGRTVYSPLFSGVFWDAQDVMLEDIDRIEVISGPGGTLWGSNAVNGVINVITRSSKDTQGGLLVAGAGNRENGDALRYGGKLDNGGSYRVYGKYADYENTTGANGVRMEDGWRRSQAGFRTDWEASAGSAFTLQGDAYRGDLHQAGTQAIIIGGANINGSWNKLLDNGSRFRLQAYWDHTDRNQPGAYIDHLDTANIELQHSFKLTPGQEIVWGAGYRYSWDRVQNGTAFSFLPASLNMHWGNVFAQDEIALRDNLHLTVGAKVETNIYTGAELLPSVRLAWKVAPQHLLWSAISRVVRAPSRIDRDFYSPSKPLSVVGGVPQYLIAGGPSFASEVAKVYEIGYRGQVLPSVSFSSTAFYQDYDHVRTLEPGPGGINLTFQNKASGSSSGLENWGTWQVLKSWRLSAGYVWQHVRTKLDPDSHDVSTASALAGDDPASYWSLRSSVDIARNQELDVSLRHVGALPAPVVPAYYAVDLRYAWRVTPKATVALIGQNLFDKSHPEFGTAPGYSQLDRSFFVKLNLRF